jgi:hypothetical protein
LNPNHQSFNAGGWEDTHPHFAERLRATDDGIVLQNITFASIGMAEDTAARVMALRDHWSIAIHASHGLPHMQLGVKYSGLLAHGSIHDAFDRSESDTQLMWREFGGFYDLLRGVLETELREPVAMHRWLWPPPFLIWLSNTAFAAQSDIHYDPRAARWYEEMLQRHWAENSMPSRRCNWDQQHTLIAGVQAPMHATNGSFGVDLWSYNRGSSRASHISTETASATGSDGTNGGDASRDVHYGVDCASAVSAEALIRCVEKRTIPYQLGKIVMFPSARFHSSKPWTQVCRNIYIICRKYIVLMCSSQYMLGRQYIYALIGNARDCVNYVTIVVSARRLCLMWTRG